MFAAGLDFRRDSPRSAELAHVDASGVFQPVTRNDFTISDLAPYASVDRSISRFLTYSPGVRHDELSFGNRSMRTVSSLASLGDEVVDGNRLTKIAFRNDRGTRTPAALALRGREYPLELSGTAWINAETAAIAKISAGIENTMVDVGLNTLQTEVEFAPFPFPDLEKTYWFPLRAVVEVETPRQHWRNTHQFTNYKRFSVSAEEQVATR